MRTLSIITLCGAMLAASHVHAAGPAPTPAWSKVGRAATPAEIKAWDIDVRADFKGLPKGSGTVAQGEQVWEARCASCHGTFAESNAVFTPLVGGTTAADIKSGHAASLAKGDVPQRSTMMKLAHLSTLWDYINRAMPWNAPKSLTTDEVYAVTAYILNLAEVVPEDFTLSQQNIAEVQRRLPNRDGLVLRDDMWQTRGKGDVINPACMSNCEGELALSSFLPDSARNAHGNLAEQNRGIGPVRGTDTTKAAAGAAATGAVALTKAVAPAAPASVPSAPLALLGSSGCTACHAAKARVVGPAFQDIAAKYKGKPNLDTYLADKIRSGGSGLWGAIPMPAQSQLKDADLKTIVAWLAAGAK